MADLAHSLGEKIEPYLPKLIPLLFTIMHEQKASNKNKLMAITAIGDIALSAPLAIKGKTY